MGACGFTFQCARGRIAQWAMHYSLLPSSLRQSRRLAAMQRSASAAYVGFQVTDCDYVIIYISDHLNSFEFI